MRRVSEALVLLALLTSCTDDKTVVVQGACGETRFPPAPEGTKQVIYVAKNCPAAGADGSREHPYNAVQQGLDAVASNGAVLVAPGTYDESMTVSRPVAVVGGTDDEGVGVVMRPKKVGGSVSTETDDDTVSVTGVRIEGASGYGLLLARGHLVLTDVVIASTVRGPLPGADEGSPDAGYGLAAIGGQLEGTRVTIDGSADTGLLVDGARGLLQESQVRGNGLGGIRLQQVGDGFTVDHCELADNTELGIGIFAGPVVLTGNTVSATRAHPDTGIGDGVLISHFGDDPDASPITITASLNTVTGSERVGMLLGSGSEGEVADNEISDSAAKATFGAGVWLQGKAGRGTGLTLRRNSILRNRFVGLGATSGSLASVEENTIEKTIAGSTILDVGSALIGDGVSLFDKATVKLRANTIAGSPRYGVTLDGADLASRVEDNTITSDQSAPMKAGIAVQKGAGSADLVALVSGNTEDGQTDKAPLVATFTVRKEDFAQVQ